MAQKKYGCGYLGLLSHRKSKGNRQRKLPEATLQLMEEFIDQEYETLKQKSMWSVYCSLRESCEQKGIISPSYKTFSKAIKKRSGYEQTLKRKGRRAAYAQSKFYWELNGTTPRHGDRPFEICHIDHTQLDVELLCSRTGRSLGRPWVTFLIDAYSRRLLAVYLTFDSPSYRSCLMVLRLCVQKYGRLPQTIVVDNGAEFHSIYFETLLATFECTKKHQPAAKGRFGSVCERLFGTNNTQFIYNLEGNTQIMRNVRQVTKSVNPKTQAIWTLGTLYEYLTQWAYEVYDTEDHPSLGQSPREAFSQGILQGGNRNHRLIPYDDNFKILTLPTTSSGKAKVQQSRGVKINSIYYWSNLFRNPEVENTSVPIRYDPFNIGIAYAFVQDQWVECISQYYSEFQVKICYYINISVADFITENLINKEFSTRSLPFHPQKSRQRAGNPKLDRDKVKKILEAILEDNQSTPLSMPQVAQAINYEVKTIYNNFPELYRKISAKYTDHKKSTFLKKIEKCCQEVREAAFELHRRGDYPSEAKISELISHPGHLRYKKVRDAVKKAKQELGINQSRK